MLFSTFSGIRNLLSLCRVLFFAENSRNIFGNSGSPFGNLDPKSVLPDHLISNYVFDTDVRGSSCVPDWRELDELDDLLRPFFVTKSIV